MTQLPLSSANGTCSHEHEHPRVVDTVFGTTTRHKEHGHSHRVSRPYCLVDIQVLNSLISPITPPSQWPNSHGVGGRGPGAKVLVFVTESSPARAAPGHTKNGKGFPNPSSTTEVNPSGFRSLSPLLKRGLAGELLPFLLTMSFSGTR
jgi:hypothetical protein